MKSFKNEKSKMKKRVKNEKSKIQLLKTSNRAVNPQVPPGTPPTFRVDIVPLVATRAYLR